MRKKAKRSAKIKPTKESGLLTSMGQALAYAQGDESKCRVTRFPKTIDVRAVRKRQHMTQAQFAEAYGFSVDSLQNWEQGRRHPDGPARALLAVIDYDAEIVGRALASLAI